MNRTHLAATSGCSDIPLLLHIIVNAYWEALDFELPVLDEAQGSWRHCIDTFRDPPHDICGWTDGEGLQTSACRVQPRSIVLLLARA